MTKLDSGAHSDDNGTMPSQRKYHETWTSTLDVNRKRKHLNLTVEPETIGILDDLAALAGTNRGRVVEDLARKAYDRIPRAQLAALYATREARKTPAKRKA